MPDLGFFTINHADSTGLYFNLLFVLVRVVRGEFLKINFQKGVVK